MLTSLSLFLLLTTALKFYFVTLLFLIVCHFYNPRERDIIINGKVVARASMIPPALKKVIQEVKSFNIGNTYRLHCATNSNSNSILRYCISKYSNVSD